MSLVISIKAADGIILAGDTRGTTGDPRGLTAISDIYKKIGRLSNCCGIGVAGSTELGAALLDNMESKVAGKGLLYIDEMLEYIRVEFKTKFNEWFSNVPLNERPPILFLLCGYRSKDQSLEPMIFSLQSQLDFAPMLHTAGRAMIGVPQYAVYLWNRYYDPKMSKSDAAALVEYLIFETATQDPKVGGPINIAEITSDNGYRELSEKEVDNIRKANDSQSLKLRGFFFAGR